MTREEVLELPVVEKYFYLKQLAKEAEEMERRVEESKRKYRV